jgi:hypothetical protein
MKKALQIIGIALLLALPAFSQTILTPNVGLQIPAGGSNNWNLPLNYNFNLIDQILGGTVQVPGLGLALTPIFGVGAPATACSANNQGQEYFDTSTSPFNGYVCNNLVWNNFGSGGGGGGGGGAFPNGFVFGTSSTTARTAVPTDISFLLSTLTGCSTAGFLYSPASGNCIAGGGGGGSSNFSALIAGTNNTAAMVVGSGASMTASGTGSIVATAMPYSALTGTVPIWNQSTTGDAATADALSGTPTVCSAGQVPIGIQANGNATGCFNPSGSVSGTTGSYGLFVSGSAIGNGNFNYGITTAGTNTSTVPFQVNDGSGAGGTFTSYAGSAPSGATGLSRLYDSSTTNQFMVNMNNVGQAYLVSESTAATPGDCVIFDTDGIRVKDSGVAGCSSSGGTPGTPSFTGDAGAGTGGSLVISLASGSNDNNGFVNLTTGNSPATPSPTVGVITITFGGTFSSARKCSTGPSSKLSQALGSGALFVPSSGSTATNFVLTNGGSALPANTTGYQWWYRCGN